MIIVCTLYHFVRLDDAADLRQPLLDVMESNSLRGTVLLAREGINGTVAGPRQGIDTFIRFLQHDPRFEGLDWKESTSSEMPFYRAKVKLKKEIVTMGIEDIDPATSRGSYVKPREWNRLISDPDVTLIDTRNDYEVKIGTFKGAINPRTSSFREFPEYVKTHLDPEKNQKVAMFCTGGIRCEKSTAYLKSLGFEEVFHLEGGILKYLEEVDEDESLWQGECFVFDNRVTVKHNLEEGDYDQCHACRMPVSEADKRNENYIPGVSCPHCADKYTAEQRERFQERERQVALSEQRGEAHLGADGAATQAERRALKKSSRSK